MRPRFYLSWLASLLFVFALFSLASLQPALAQTAPAAVGISVGGDNLTRLLWNNPDGSVSLWRINADGSITPYTYGPFGGWSGASLAVGPDNISHLLWDNTSGYGIVWDINSQGVNFNANSEVSYSPAGYTAAAVAVGPNGAVRVLWGSAGGSAQLWNLADAQPQNSYLSFGPLAGFRAQGLAVGPDNKARILWTKPDGTVQVWTINPDGTLTSSTAYSPYVNGLRIDAGSSTASADAQGNRWAADYGFSGGTTTTTTASISALYQTQRVGASFSYALSIPNGKYILGLSFAETGSVTANGQRVFNVSANGTPLLTGFDIFAAAGGANKAITQSFLVNVTNGQLALTLTGTTGQAALAALSLTVPSPAPDIPAPGWAEDVMPTDDASDADGLGPAAASSVNLASGAEENSPGPDLWAFNPLGPGASYERRYRSARAKQGYASPGLSPGWTDGYDLFVTPTAGGYTLTYDNGGQEQWTGTTGSLGTPAGAPYLVNASGGALTMTFKDRSKYIFTQVPTAGGNYPANAYLLTGITNLVGHRITLNRDTAANGYRLLSISNDAAPATALLLFAYDGSGKLFTVSDAYGRQITYGFTDGLLGSVSQIAAAGTSSPPARWQYGYTPVQGALLLSSVLAPDPSNPGAMATATTTYDPATGTVMKHQDVSGRVHSYGYGGSQTVVQVKNADNTLAETWTQKQNAGGAGLNADTGTTDAAGKAGSISYAGTPSPYLPGAATNRNGQTSQVTYDTSNPYANVLTAQSPRGVVATTTYQYPTDFPLGQPASVQRTHVNASGVTDSTQTATTFDYYGSTDIPTDNGPAETINGLVKAVHSPFVGSINQTPAITTTYTYDSLGNVSQVTMPNANSTNNSPSTYQTTTYNYTSYSFTDANSILHSYSQPEALGEPVSVAVTGPDYHPQGTVAPYTSSTTTIYYQYDQRGNRTAVIDALGNETDFVYNLADQLISIVHPATGDSGSGHSKNTTTYQYPGGPASSAAIYDESGNLFRQVNSVYSPDGELVSVSGDTYPVLYGYDGRGRVRSVTYYQQQPPQMSLMYGKTTFYDYDSVGNLAAVRYPNQSGATFDKHQYFYDNDANLSKEIDGNNLEKDYLRGDPESLLTGLHYVYPSGYAGTQIADVGFTYDAFGRRSSMADSTGTKTYTYSDLDYPLMETVNFNGGPQNQQIRFGYNYDGSRYSLRVNLSVTLGSSPNQKFYDFYTTHHYSYDGTGRLVRDLAGQNSYNGIVVLYSYYRNGWLHQSATSTNYNSNYGTDYIDFQALYQYNNRGFLTSLENDQIAKGSANSSPLLSKFTGMVYDPVGNRLSETAAIPVTEEGFMYGTGYAYPSVPDASRTILYNYNNRDELIGEQSQSIASASNSNDLYSENYTNGFGYDLTGNSTLFRGTAASFNSDNQSSTNTPDGNGNPVSYQGSAFRFDPEDRLTSVPGMLTAAYDGDGLRAWKQDQAGNREYYLYDGNAPIQEEHWANLTYDPTKTYFASDIMTSHVYCFGPDGWKSTLKDETPSQLDQSSIETYAYDPQGNLVERLAVGTSNSYAGVRDVVAYDAYGSLRQDCNFGAFYPSLTQVKFPVGFGGQHGYFTDPETGLSLLTHRYYDAGAGRFVTRDPIGYKGGINLYGFAGNNPVNESDPSGFAPTLGQSIPDPLEKGMERVWEKLAPGIARQLIRPAGTGLRMVGGTAAASVTLFFMAQTRVADSSTGPGSPYYNQQRDRWLKKHAKYLLNGENIEVGSIRDADDLLTTALPNAQKAPGAGPTEEGESPDFSQFKGTNPNGMYHKDYLVDPQTGRIYGHDANNAHGGYKHINIKLPSGKKVFIKITPRTPFR